MEGEVVIEVILCERRRLSLLRAEIRNFAKRLWVCGKCGCGQTRLLGFGPVCDVAKSLLRATEGRERGVGLP